MISKQSSTESSSLHLPLNGKKLYVAGQVSCVGSRTHLDSYENYLKGFGCSTTSDSQEADILLVDTCGVSQLREDQSVELVEENKRFAKPGAKVIVCGCLVGINPQRVKEKVGVDCFSPKNEAHLAEILKLGEFVEKKLDKQDIRGRFMGRDWIPESRAEWMLRAMLLTLHLINRVVPLKKIGFFRTTLDSTQAVNPRAYALTIGQGCYGNCSFCAIPSAKGKTSSQRVGSIVERVQELVHQGVRDIILTSEDTGAYGLDMDTSIVDLLRKVQQVEGDFKICVLFFDPRWLRSYKNELSEILKAGKIAFLQLPIQSGSNGVLKRMRRAYTIDPVMNAIQDIKRANPHVTIATQVIVGFPGETLEEFSETRALLEQGLFDRVDIFPFSRRPGTPAEEMEQQIEQKEIRRRCRTLNFAWFAARLFRGNNLHS